MQAKTIQAVNDVNKNKVQSDRAQGGESAPSVEESFSGLLQALIGGSAGNLGDIHNLDGLMTIKSDFVEREKVETEAPKQEAKSEKETETQQEVVVAEKPQEEKKQAEEAPEETTAQQASVVAAQQEVQKTTEKPVEKQATETVQVQENVVKQQVQQQEVEVVQEAVTQAKPRVAKIATQPTTEVAQDAAPKVALMTDMQTEAVSGEQRGAPVQLTDRPAGPTVLQPTTNAATTSAPTAPRTEAPQVTTQNSANLLLQALNAADLGLAKRGVGLTNESALRQSNAATLALDSLGGKSNDAKTQAAVTKLNSTTQVKVIERIQQIADTLAANRELSTLVVRLDPPELGEMTVKVTQRGDQIFARISPESPDVEAMLKGRVKEVSQALAHIGLKGEDVHVSVGQDVSDVTPFQFAFGGDDRYAQGQNSTKQGQEGFPGSGFDSPDSAITLPSAEAGYPNGSVNTGWVA